MPTTVTDESTLTWFIFLFLLLSIPSTARDQTKLHAGDREDITYTTVREKCMAILIQSTYTASGDVFLTMGYSVLVHALRATFCDSMLQNYGVVIKTNGILIAPPKIIMTSRSH